jgi:hypothetical protein
MIVLWVVVGILPMLLGRFGQRAWRSHTSAPLIEEARGIVAGAAAGVLWGIGAHAAMRAEALAAVDPTAFTVGGTLLVLVAGAILGAVLGLVFASVRRWLPFAGAPQARDVDSVVQVRI